MPASALLLAASAGVRAASLNLCSDEYLLLLAKPSEVASVSYLSQDRLETPLWRLGRFHHANRGSIEQVLSERPTLLLNMGGGGRATALLARRIGVKVVELPPPLSIADVEANLNRVAAALGQPGRAAPWVQRLRLLRQSSPATARDTIWLGSGGDSLASGSVGAEWLRLAGLRQRPLRGGRAGLETLLVRPPQMLVESRYRRQQISSGTRWLDHPVVRNLPSRRLTTDGRSWTCMGPLLIGEVERLRMAAQ
ncbi:MAG: hypothetical protein M3Q52_00615 [Pseudomonadota bacterium]|nr:hypothetical protein [Pseudomonadota bacterium]